MRPGFDLGLEKVMMKSLADDPHDRYANAAEFGAEIRKFIRERFRSKA